MSAGTVTIRRLKDLTAADLRLLNVGYTSKEKYAVTKQESEARTWIGLDLITLAKPYVKQWETDDEEVRLAKKVVSKRMSWGAYVDRELVALAIAEPSHWNKTVWVREFHVAVGWHHQGIGRRLMERLVSEAGKAGFCRLALDTQNTNVPAIRFYRAMGFEIEGFDLSFYSNHDMDRGEVAIFMARKIQ